METKTTTAEALLGMLSLRPMSGYELRQAIGESIGNFWSESYGQIYPTLKKLAAEGLVRGSEGDRAGSTVYELTAAGQERLRDWLGVMPRPQVNRDELLLKLFFGNLGGPQTAIAQVGARRRALAGDLARYERIEAHLRKEHSGHPALPYWLMTVRYGILEAKMTIEWCDETLWELSVLGLQKPGRVQDAESLAR